MASQPTVPTPKPKPNPETRLRNPNPNPSLGFSLGDISDLLFRSGVMASPAEARPDGLAAPNWELASSAATNGRTGVNAREVYGFVGWCSSAVVTVLWFLWAITPDSWLVAVGVAYYPAKYWAIALPCQLCVSVVLFYWIYDGLNRAFVLSPGHGAQISDAFANVGEPDKPSERSIPSLVDLDMRHVCRVLYGKQQSDK